jgi:hypothetical protein
MVDFPEGENDAVGVGNAIVGPIARSEGGFLGDHGLANGAVTLIDANRAEVLYEGMGPTVEVSAGRIATIAAAEVVGQFGPRARQGPTGPPP